MPLKYGCLNPKSYHIRHVYLTHIIQQSSKFIIKLGEEVDIRMTIKQQCQQSLIQVHSLSKARVHNVIMYLEVRMARRDTKRIESTTMTMMSRRDGLTDMADNAEEIAACWYTPNPPPWRPCPCPRLAIFQCAAVLPSSPTPPLFLLTLSSS